MKSFEQSFREFLTEAELGQYVDGGQVTLFHYTKHPGNEKHSSRLVFRFSQLK
jgi:hypothetical protein